MTKLVETTASKLILRSAPFARADTDTGQRFVRGQTAIALGETFDKQWTFLDAPAGDGWASAAYLAPATAPAPTTSLPSSWPRLPNGRAEIIAVFGQPCQPVCESGRVTLPATLPLSWALSQKVTRFACHELMEDVFATVFAEIHRRGFWPLLEDFGGCYNCREQRGTNAKTSTHSWGIGIDINALQNPLGAPPKMPQEIVEVFREYGFQWGGTWSRPDGMHFQYATGY